jgi:hypothetical protein
MQLAYQLPDTSNKRFKHLITSLHINAIKRKEAPLAGTPHPFTMVYKLLHSLSIISLTTATVIFDSLTTKCTVLEQRTQLQVFSYCLYKYG